MGCAMGTICAPSYANIFMANFEAKHIYPYIKEKSLLYLRYIDDIFMIWKGTKVELIRPYVYPGMLRDGNNVSTRT